jgi:hypothetical protein
VAWEEERRRYRPDAPLSIRFSLAQGTASWDLGPPGGEFAFVSVPAYSAFPIPPRGSQRVAVPRERHRFRIRRSSPDGSWTLSPVLPVPREREVTVWRRSGEPAPAQERRRGAA